MKKIGGIILILAMALFGVALAQKMDKGKAEPMKTITGQVVDYECCSKSNGMMLGGDHQECAEACVNKMNLPIGILTKDKKLYVALSSKMMSAEAREKLAPLLNKQVIAVVSVEEIK